MRTDQARALGDPTRAALFRAVVDAGEPLPVVTLAERVGLLPNAVRVQLGQLVAVGLIEESVDPVRRVGRPRHLYRPAPGAAGTGSVGEHPYERLSLLLLEVLTTGSTPEEVGAEHGRVLARHATGSRDPLAALEHELAVEGFGPRLEAEPDGSPTLVLGACPLAAAVHASPDAVCDLHLGMCRGLAETVGGLRVTGIDRSDPDVGGCRVRLEVTATAGHSPVHPSGSPPADGADR